MSSVLIHHRWTLNDGQVYGWRIGDLEDPNACCACKPKCHRLWHWQDSTGRSYATSVAAGESAYRVAGSDRRRAILAQARKYELKFGVVRDE